MKATDALAGHRHSVIVILTVMAAVTFGPALSWAINTVQTGKTKRLYEATGCCPHYLPEISGGSTPPSRCHAAEADVAPAPAYRRGVRHVRSGSQSEGPRVSKLRPLFPQ
jgi:hypothetical protein